MEKIEKPSVLILCTGNTSRSRMAEGLLKQYAGGFLGNF
jgi:protein-tyrosine-phosphatase